MIIHEWSRSVKGKDPICRKLLIFGGIFLHIGERNHNNVIPRSASDVGIPLSKIPVDVRKSTVPFCGIATGFALAMTAYLCGIATVFTLAMTAYHKDVTSLPQY